MSNSTGILFTLPFPDPLISYLKSLHTKSLDQESAIDTNATAAIKARYPSDPEGAKREMDDLMRDKYIALDSDKCVFIYNVLLSIGARTVVDVGTSFGVSTIYLALAVSEVAKRNGGKGRVIATEKEGSKTAVARETWKKADPDGELGIEKVIELREGDLEETLKGDVEGEVDFVLLDSESALSHCSCCHSLVEHQVGADHNSMAIRGIARIEAAVAANEAGSSSGDRQCSNGCCCVSRSFRGPERSAGRLPEHDASILRWVGDVSILA